MFDSLYTIRKNLDNGSITMVEVVRHYLKQIDAQNPTLNAFLEVYPEEALAQAAQIDQKLQAGTAGKLAGLVMGLKDVIAYKNHKLTASSRILGDFRSQISATVVEKLLAEDAIIIGRQNCDEFAMGSSSENSAFGAVRNAADISRVSGGSSGGSAVSVQSGMCLAALGSDTGGSVRQPASFCGVVGMKPTYGRVSRHGLIAYGSSFDVIGILTKKVQDSALILEVIAGKDDFDATVSSLPVPEYSKHLEMKKQPKIAYFGNILESTSLNADVRNAMLDKIDFLKKQGFTVESIDFPYLDYFLPTYYILTTAEASTNLSRYDGIRYGYRSSNFTDLESLYKHSRSEAFGDEVKRRILLGTFVLSASYFDAYFTKAQKVRRLIQQKTNEILTKYDFILSPTSPSTAFKIGEKSSDPIEMYLADIFSVQANLAGIPAITIPCGQDQNGMPIGLQIMNQHFAETELLAFAKYLNGE